MFYCLTSRTNPLTLTFLGIVCSIKILALVLSMLGDMCVITLSDDFCRWAKDECLYMDRAYIRMTNYRCIGRYMFASNS